MGRSDLPTILVFLKAPRLGAVKTRLAASTSDRHAQRVYRHLAVSQLERIPPEWPVEIHFDPPDQQPEMERWLGNRYPLYPQCGGDLGQRLCSAVASAQSRGANGMICIGADCLSLGADQFKRAHSLLLERIDVVFGPCDDGGYYLIAMRQLHEALFRQIPWSSKVTLAASLKTAENEGLRTALTEPLFDIDELPQLQRAVSIGICPTSLLPTREERP